MKLILVRHGEAGVHSYDELRELTARGIAQAQWTANHLLSQYQPDVLIASPLMRAQQTAQVIAEHMSTPIQLHTCDLIKPDDDAMVAFDWLAEQQGACIVVVCHMNIIAEIDALMTGNHFSGFDLAEYRVYEQPMLLPELCQLIQRAVPQV